MHFKQSISQKDPPPHSDIILCILFHRSNPFSTGTLHLTELLSDCLRKVTLNESLVKMFPIRPFVSFRALQLHSLVQTKRAAE